MAAKITLTLVNTIDELRGPWVVAVSNDGRHVVVAECWIGSVSVLDSEGKKEVVLVEEEKALSFVLLVV